MLASVLTPKHQVIAMDLKGRGQSGKPPSGYSVDHHLRDINCLLDDLGLERVVLMGHSLGAFISLAFGAEYSKRVDSIILVDGGGDLSEEQLDRVFEGIRPSLDRLGQAYPSADAYIEAMRQAPYIQPWSPALETYYRYEIEEVRGGVSSNIDPAHIQEEALNVRKLEAASLYPKLSCKVLILRATKGLLSQDDILLPGDVVEKMLREIPNARHVDVEGTNHYGIIFQPHELRDSAILDFLKT
jgi:pimeloyl-ACP methyl ester carboxylesterase